MNAGTLTASAQVFLNGPGFVNQGTALAVNGSGRACFSPRSVLTITTFQTDDNANSMTVSPTTWTPACISSYGNFNSLLATDVPSKVSICRVGIASAAELARYGTAQVTQNCISCQTVLPVVLLTFTAVADGPQAVRLTWATASEYNSAYFEMERSLNGTTFARVGTVPTIGNSRTTQNYSLADLLLLAGTAMLYYRLHQVA